MSSFVRNDAVTPDGRSAKRCIMFGTGGCCYDKHFDPREVLPESPVAKLCGAEDSAKSTTVKTAVNCTECLELMHA